MRRLMIGLTLVCMAALIPLWVRADDRQIAQKIIQQLQKHKDSGELKGFGIDLQVEKGVVLMKGRVRTAKQKQLALSTVRRIDGVKQVVNKLKISNTPALKVQTAEKRKPVAKAAFNTTLAKLKGVWNSTGKTAAKLTSIGAGKKKTTKVAAVQTDDKATVTEVVTEVVTATEAELLAEKDGQIAQQVVDRLKGYKEEGKLADFRVNLSVDNGTVWLEGDVASRDQRLLVLELARNISGVQQVVNELKIRESKEPTVAVKEATPAEKPFSQIADQPTEQPMPETVAIPIVTPIPVVASKPMPEVVAPEKVAEQPQVAETVKTTLPQSKKAPLVEDQLAKDGQIAKVLAERLEMHKDHGNLKEFTVNLRVDEGVVWLQGEVPSFGQRGLILEVARHVPGVSKIICELQIMPPAPLLEAKPGEIAKPEAEPEDVVKPEALGSPELDGQIASLVSKQFEKKKQEGYLQDFDVNLSVNRGIVWMQGEVNSLGQKGLMLELARHVPGVKRVVNELEVTPAANTAPLAARHPVGTAVSHHQLSALPIPREVAAQAVLPAATAPHGYPVPMRYIAQQVQPPSYMPAHAASVPSPVARTRYDHPQMPAYAWPTYASHPNYAAVTYPKQYSPTAWPYIGPFYPYPQVPMGWRKVTLEWDDGWWNLDFKNSR